MIKSMYLPVFKIKNKNTYCFLYLPHNLLRSINNLNLDWSTFSNDTIYNRTEITNDNTCFYHHEMFFTQNKWYLNCPDNSFNPKKYFQSKRSVRREKIIEYNLF